MAPLSLHKSKAMSANNNDVIQGYNTQCITLRGWIKGIGRDINLMYP